MDTFDLYMASEVKKTRTAHIAIGVFFFVLFLLIILCVLFKYMFDQKEAKKKSPIKFDVTKIVPNVDDLFSKKA